MEESFDFILIGISSHENDYRLSWALNTALKINLAKKENLQVANKKHSEFQEFSLFAHQGGTGYQQYNLISNRCDNGFLLEEFKNIDFLLQVSGSPLAKQDLMNTIKTIEIVTLAFEIDPRKVKNKKALLL